MTHATYVDAGPQGPGRGGTRQRTGPTLWIVFHTSEGGEGETSAENLAAFIRTPATDGNVASYQVIFDTDRVLQIMPPDMRSHHAAGANDQGLGGCFPGKADQTRAEWLDGTTAQYLEQGCRWAADMCVMYGIPPIRIGPDEMKAGAKGIVDHNTVRLAFGETSHTDCGPNFPWDVVMTRIKQLLFPAGEDDMANADEVMAAVVRLERKFDTFRDNEFRRDMAERERDRAEDAKWRAALMALLKNPE